MKIYGFKYILLMSGLLLALAACEHSKTLAPGGLDPTLANVQATILSPKCGTSGCHVPGGSGLMPLRTTNESFANLVGVASIQKTNLNRVQPGDPDNSYIVRKLEGGPDITGQRMPFGGSRLSDTEIDLVRNWIANGALNN